MKTLKFRFLCSGLLCLICLLTLTGCPGIGDRVRFDETAQVRIVGDDVCFLVADAQDYQPADMGINPRGTASKNKTFIFEPNLTVANGKLCIPPSFYHFPDKGQFIVEYILISKKYKDEPRKVVVTLEVMDGHIYNIPPNDMEITRPYSEMNKE
ncbi:putative T6SS immunity periplasmic lipoprotein [Yersinia mollaretii]|uniref:putative T6SS immunity periplasmic lipoprotein n=1 Tax=Yersinia mollaretii TaxID=33060 RepID=UPI001FCB5534|nr:putative T6SS immunity periplasmic lipoprotein [Yersinia mollaretii]